MNKKERNRFIRILLWPVMAPIWLLGWTLGWIGERQEYKEYRKREDEQQERNDYLIQQEINA